MAAPDGSRESSGWVFRISTWRFAVGVTRGARRAVLDAAAIHVRAAASWNPGLALLYGQVIGRELRDQGYNMSIGGASISPRAAQRA